MYFYCTKRVQNEKCFNKTSNLIGRKEEIQYFYT